MCKPCKINAILFDEHRHPTFFVFDIKLLKLAAVPKMQLWRNLTAMLPLQKCYFNKKLPKNPPKVEISKKK